jgi:hypothetical protein
MGSRTRHYVYANIITAIHVGWTFLIFGGAIFLLFNHTYAIPQIIVLSATLLVSIPFKNVCPLTLLEEKLRQKYDPAYTNRGSYMTTYLNKIFKTNFTVKRVNGTVAVLYVFVYAFAAWVLVR